MAVTQIVGASGSGLTRRLTSMYENIEGAVMLTAEPRAHITYLRATVEEELAFGLEQRGVAVSEMARRVVAMAEALNLTDLLDRTPNQLSGGQTRRLAIGTVAILGAPVVLFDDPFSGLDPHSRGALAQLLRTLDADVVVAGHRAWMEGVETEFLGEEGVLELPASLPAVNGEYVRFENIVGHRGGGERRWWQFRKPRSHHFEIGPVSVSAPRGGVLWLRGPNGSGKSTLMRAMVDHCDSVGLMVQDPVDQVIDPLVEQMVPDAQLRDVFDLDGQEHPLDLSQRGLRLAQFASVVGQGVDVLCADEPDVGLDVRGRNQLHEGFAKHLRGGGTLVLACHDKAFIEEVRAYALVEVHQLG